VKRSVFASYRAGEKGYRGVLEGGAVFTVPPPNTAIHEYTPRMVLSVDTLKNNVSPFSMELSVHTN